MPALPRDAHRLIHFGAVDCRATVWVGGRLAAVHEGGFTPFTTRSLPVLSGFCDTQFADTDQEANGWLFANREPKFPVEPIAQATSGARNDSSVTFDPLAAAGLDA